MIVLLMKRLQISLLGTVASLLQHISLSNTFFRTIDVKKVVLYQLRSQPNIWSCKCKVFCVYRPYKESISKEMNNDYLNLHIITKLSG